MIVITIALDDDDRKGSSIFLGQQLAHLDLQTLTKSISEESQRLYFLSVLGIGHHGFLLSRVTATSREVKLHMSFSTEMR
jgi:hypothetical protein